MNIKQLSAVLQNKFESYSDIPAIVKDQLIYLMGEGSIDLFLDSSDDLKIFEWFKEQGLYSSLKATSETEGTVRLALKQEPSENRIDIVHTFRGEQCLFLNGVQLAQWEPEYGHTLTKSIYEVANDLAKSLNCPAAINHDLTIEDLESIGSDSDSLTFDDVTQWLNRKLDDAA